MRIPTAEGPNASYHPPVSARLLERAEDAAPPRAPVASARPEVETSARPGSPAGFERPRGGGLAVCVLWLVLAFFLGPRIAWAGDLRFEVVSSDVPTTLPVDREVHLHVELRNVGSETWDPAQKDRLAYHLRDPESGESILFEGRRSELPRAVGPGESVELDAIVWVGSDAVASYRGASGTTAAPRVEFEWAMVRENVRWYPRPAAGERPGHPVDLVAAHPEWSAAGIELSEAGSPEPNADLPLVDSGAQIRVRFELRNEGWTTWRSELGDRVAMRWYLADGRPLKLEGRRTALPRDVAVGDRVFVEAVAEVPEGSGEVELRVEPVREGVRWYGPGRESPGLRLRVREHPLQWELLSLERPGSVPADSTRTLRVTIRNVGRESWDARDRLSYRVEAADTPRDAWEEGPRTLLPGPVAPGESVELDAAFLAPSREGTAVIHWEMLREGARWFGPPRGEDSGQLRIELTRPRLAWRLVAADPPSWGWTGSDIELPVVLENTGADPWEPSRGDRLAYHWLGPDGAMLEFEGLRSELPGVVAPGARVELLARVRLPREPGPHRLEFEMLREQQRWYGDAQVATTDFRAFARVTLLIGGLALGWLALSWLYRRFGRVADSRGWRRVFSPQAREFLDVVWVAVTLGATTVAFAEIGEEHFWKGGFEMAWGTGALLALPSALFLGRGRRLVGALLCTLAALVAFSDLIYLHFFGSIVPLSAIGHAGLLGEVLESVATHLRWGQLWLFALPLCAWLGWWTQRDLPPPERHGLRRRLVPALACLAFAWPSLQRYGEAMEGALGERVFSEQNMVGRFGIFGAHLLDAARTLREMRERGEIDPAAYAEVEAWFQERADGVGTPEFFGVAEGHNVLLVQVEALQEWVVGLEVQGQPVTPFLNSVSRRGLRFDHVIDQTAQGKTSDGEYLALNSQHPIPRGSTAFLRAGNHFHTLAHILAERGYTTASAHPYRRGFWNRAVLHPRYGFQQSVFRRELGPGPQTGWGLADGAFFERMLPRLQALSEPWFSFWITLSLHHPYSSFPEAFSELELGELEGEPLGNYLQAMRYFDRSLEALMNGLEAAGLADHTVVVVYGDHDARFEYDEHPELLELIGDRDWDPSTFWRLERVPLFVIVPGGPTGERPTLGGQIDIAPTILGLLGIDRPVDFVGRSLLSEPSPPWVAYPSGAAYVEDRVWVPSGRGIPLRGACFHLPSGRHREVEDCAALRDDARLELEMSRRVVDADLQRRLAGLEMLDD